MNKLIQYFLAIATLIDLRFTSITIPICPSSIFLNSFGFLLNPNPVNQTTICPIFYSNNGSCVDVSTTRVYLNQVQNWFQQQSKNAFNYSDLYKKVSVYWRVINGFVSTPSLTSVLPSNIPQILTKLTNNLWNNADLSIQNRQLTNSNAVSPCFQVLANLTNGIYCGITSNNRLFYQNGSAKYPNSIPITIPVNSSKIGTSLQTCLPLIDNYCSLSFGLSISDLKLPFNITFDWGDGGLQMSDCQTYQTLINCTSANCTNTLNNMLVDLFYTNWVPFVPSAVSIVQLQNYLSQFDNSTIYQPIPSRPSGMGIQLVTSPVGTPIDFYISGVGSGQSNVIYTRFEQQLKACCFLLLILFGITPSF